MPGAGSLPRALVRLRSGCERGAKAIKRVWWTEGKATESLLPLLSPFRDWNEMDFAIHWGQARVRPRYAEAVTARTAHAAPTISVALSRE